MNWKMAQAIAKTDERSMGTKSEKHLTPDDHIFHDYRELTLFP